MQIRSFLLPIMLATSVSFVACSSSDDEKDAMTANPEMIDMSAETNVEQSQNSTESETHLSYYIGFNVSSSIKTSNPFTLDLEIAIEGLKDGSKSIESKVTQAQLEAANVFIRTKMEAKATNTDTSTEQDEMAVTPEEQMVAKHLSYYIGYNISSSIVTSQTFNLDLESSIEGLTDGSMGKESKVTPEQLQAADAELRAQFEAKQAALSEEQAAKQQEMQIAQMEQAEIAKTEGLAFLEKNKMVEGVMTTDSGLQYSVITKGDASSAMPSPTDTVNVHYHGTLTNGNVFDSSVERGAPISFPLNGVIPGWTEGLQLMNIGDKFRFFIPSDLAYGARATGSIPANSVLIFDVELLDINPE